MKTELLKLAYMFIYEQFAADTKEVLKYLEVDRSVALSVLDQLESMGLITGEFHDGKGTFFGGTAKEARQRSVGKNKMWQCWETYDTENSEDAEKRIDAAIAKLIPGASQDYWNSRVKQTNELLERTKA